jgi:hypothetical protein
MYTVNGIEVLNMAMTKYYGTSILSIVYEKDEEIYYHDFETGKPRLIETTPFEDITGGVRKDHKRIFTHGHKCGREALNQYLEDMKTEAMSYIQFGNSTLILSGNLIQTCVMETKDGTYKVYDKDTGDFVDFEYDPSMTLWEVTHEEYKKEFGEE